MIFFITVLRALAACLITNAHYTGIYPTDLIANGGLIGDVLFFAVSGYCLYNIKLSFGKWYAKRLYRIYMPVLIITLIYVLLGSYTFEEHNALWWFIYPTCYHFVASIIVLYIPFWFCMKINWIREHLLAVMGAIAVIWTLIYIIFYDKSYYHIDTVREPMIRFLFMQSMLMGAYFRKNDKKIRNKFKVRHLFATLVMCLIYFVSKLAFSKISSLSNFQILNQYAILILLATIFLTFAGLDSKLEKLPNRIKEVIEFISSITLEIYVVQSVLIDKLRPIGHFPINWIVLTASILAAAFTLHKICGFIYIGINRIVNKLRN